LNHERRVVLLAFLSGLPAVAVAVLLVWIGGYTPKVAWTVTLLVSGVWVIAALALRERVVRPLQTLSNMLAALREEDFSMRARGARSDDALGLALLEVNELGQTLREQRLGALEATALLARVMEEIDVAVFAFDAERTLRLVNPAGERLLADRSERLLGRSAEALGLAECLEGEAPRVLDAGFPGGGRWELRRGTFRQGGRPHQLLVLSDLSRALRDEEREATKRLVRVLGHEINNSLAPIKSVAESLQQLVGRETASNGAGDVARGLSLIAGRAESLSRFMASYARLARLPPPRLQPLDVGGWVRRVAALERRLPVAVEPGPDLQILADGDQLDQLLINLVDNAVDAALETGGTVTVGWEKTRRFVEVWVVDEGPGLADTGNLFVPFFTTKPEGSGIGLALSRQIAEAHGGTLTLGNREEGKGAEARLRLPVLSSAAP
jgi:two-component system, NtrC family, nitrogen regulation sensor histidine kinase NtrY